MKQLASTIARLKRKRAEILDELHPELFKRVSTLLASLGDRFVPYCGYRGPEEQALAKSSGASNAEFGASPHNFRPALAVDVVLNPAVVLVRPHRRNPDFPDLWDEFTPEAIAAWTALDLAAKRYGLERVSIKRAGVLVRDLPHLQLPEWRTRIPQ